MTTSPRHGDRTIWSREFFKWGFLFSGYSRLCEFDKNTLQEKISSEFGAVGTSGYPLYPEAHSKTKTCFTNTLSVAKQWIWVRRLKTKQIVSCLKLNRSSLLAKGNLVSLLGFYGRQGTYFRAQRLHDTLVSHCWRTVAEEDKYQQEWEDLILQPSSHSIVRLISHCILIA